MLTVPARGNPLVFSEVWRLFVDEHDPVWIYGVHVEVSQGVPCVRLGFVRVRNHLVRRRHKAVQRRQQLSTRDAVYQRTLAMSGACIGGAAVQRHMQLGCSSARKNVLHMEEATRGRDGLGENMTC